MSLTQDTLGYEEQKSGEDNSSSNENDNMMIEIIESMSDDGTEDILREMLQQRQQQSFKDADNHCDEERKESDSVNSEEEDGRQPQEFSLSNIGWALHTSTAHLGSATAQLLQEAQNKSVQTLRASFSHMQLPSSPSNTTGDTNDASSRSLPTKWCDHPSLMVEQQQRRKSCVNFGTFEARASRLQYNQEDVYNIAADPAQFDHLQMALRDMGATTNLVLQEKLHWYIVNSKRARAKAAAAAAAAANTEEDVDRQTSIYEERRCD